ncbi:MAG TPA: hypothetical protein DCL77_07845 [Prolixibacteraceae bacterium]|jgi:hypothetical protein|nr:hypothetical protein [Prolixibacteraceae bacterium]
MKYLFLIGMLFSLVIYGGYAQESNNQNYLSGNNLSVATHSDMKLVTTPTYESFISESKQWRYVQELVGEPNGEICIVQNAYFKGDTLVDGAKYNKLYLKTEQPYFVKPYLAYLMREDTVNQQVYVVDIPFNKTALLYDFKLNEGDVINMYITGGIYFKRTVIKVDTITLANKKLKRIGFDGSITWIEGIGAVTRAEIPSEGELICVRENNDLLYLNPKYNSCDTIFTQGQWGAIKTIKSSEVMLFPNPIVNKSIVRVHSNDQERLKIEIYSYSGAKVKEDYFNGDYPIGTLGLGKGIYLYKIFSKNQVIKADKIVVAN